MILLFFLCSVLWVGWFLYRIFGYRYRSCASKVVLVTGACSEVGRRLCVQLRAEGASIIAWDSSKVKLDELQREILGTGGGTSGGGRPYSPAPSSSLQPSPSTSAIRGGGAGLSTSPVSPAPNAFASGGAHSTGKKASGAFFDVAMVDMASRLQVQRAVKELLASLPVLCATSQWPVNALGVDMIFNAAHVSPSKPFLERSDDTVEKVIATNTVAPLLLAKLLCPAMLERKEGGHFITFTAATGATGVDAASPDYAGSQWGAVGAHYSVRAWVRHLQRSCKLPGEVRTTLVSLDAVQLGLPTSPYTSSSSTWARQPAYGTGTGAAVSSAVASPTPTTASLLSKSHREGSPDVASDGGDSTNSSSKAPAQAAAAATAAAAASFALDRTVQRALRAVGRGEESFCPSYRAAMAPVAFLLPIPWMSSVLHCLGLAPEGKNSRKEGGGESTGRQD